jgi:hypothetical protein
VLTLLPIHAVYGAEQTEKPDQPEPTTENLEKPKQLELVSIKHKEYEPIMYAKQFDGSDLPSVC